MDHRALSAQTALEDHNSIIGIRLTLLYALLYGGFVALCVFRPAWTGARAILGLNLAIAYGLGLIIGAVILASIYNYVCRVGNTNRSSKTSKKAETINGGEEG